MSTQIDGGPARATEAAERGAAWLDEVCPDWLDHIDVVRLNMRNPRMCMLGQTEECLAPRTNDPRGGYFSVLKKFRRSPDGPWAINHGFNTTFTAGRFSFTFEMLQIAWEVLIMRRLAQRGHDRAEAQ